MESKRAAGTVDGVGNAAGRGAGPGSGAARPALPTPDRPPLLPASRPTPPPRKVTPLSCQTVQDQARLPALGCSCKTDIQRCPGSWTGPRRGTVLKATPDPRAPSGIHGGERAGQEEGRGPRSPRTRGLGGPAVRSNPPSRASQLPKPRTPARFCKEEPGARWVARLVWVQGDQEDGQPPSTPPLGVSWIWFIFREKIVLFS